MTKRSVAEIEQELKECEAEQRELININYCSETYHWRNPGVVREVNKINYHIHNLYLELERAKNRDWYKRR